jgi:hypothetical protein
MLRRVAVVAIALVIAGCSTTQANKPGATSHIASSTHHKASTQSHATTQQANAVQAVESGAANASQPRLVLTPEPIESDATSQDDHKAEPVVHIHPGERYEVLPDGVVAIAGWSLSKPDDNPAYNINHVETGGKQLLLLETVKRDRAGKAVYEVRDVLSLPDLAVSERLIAGDWCTQNRSPNPALVVVAKDTASDTLTDIDQAWVANINQGKFQEISARNITCRNSGWGL